MNPKISVVTVCYNAEKDIEKTILSVINQSYENVEYIIVDGASKDGTMDIVNKYRDKISVVVSEPDKGIYDAMNKGIKLATGDWINFMNAGDVFYNNNVLFDVVNNVDFDQKYDVIFGNTNYIYKTGVFLRQAENVDVLKHRMPFCHQSTFAYVPYIKSVLFDCSFKIAADYNFFYNSYINHKKFCYVPVCVSTYDAVLGVSSQDHSIVLKEYCKTNGDLFWFRNFNEGFRNMFRSFVKKIIPSKFFDSINHFVKKHNI